MIRVSKDGRPVDAKRIVEMPVTPIQTPCMTDPDAWFSNGEGARLAARRCGKECPLSVEKCAEAGFRNDAHEGFRWGVWGGLTAQDRARIAEGAA